MIAGGGEASVLSVQRRTNPKHVADYFTWLENAQL